MHTTALFVSLVLDVHVSQLNWEKNRRIVTETSRIWRGLASVATATIGVFRKTFCKDDMRTLTISVKTSPVDAITKCYVYLNLSFSEQPPLRIRTLSDRSLISCQSGVSETSVHMSDESSQKQQQSEVRSCHPVS